ncbi:DinB family protein [Streptomyces sp. NPDC003032]
MTTSTSTSTPASTPASASDFKTDLRLYLQDARDALLWKLEGLSEYDIRRPLTPTGTNLLGLVKHVTSAEALYFGETFGRPFDAPPLWITGDAEANSDLWATADETREQIVGLYRKVWAHSDATIESLELDAVGRVAWGERHEVTLHRILVHVIAETDRHAGHADVVRELIDGTAGLRQGADNMAQGDGSWWEAHRDRVERAAREADGDAGRSQGPGPA